MTGSSNVILTTMATESKGRRANLGKPLPSLFWLAGKCVDAFAVIDGAAGGGVVEVDFGFPVNPNGARAGKAVGSCFR